MNDLFKDISCICFCQLAQFLCSFDLYTVNMNIKYSYSNNDNNQSQYSFFNALYLQNNSRLY